MYICCKTHNKLIALSDGAYSIKITRRQTLRNWFFEHRYNDRRSKCLDAAEIGLQNILERKYSVLLLDVYSNLSGPINSKSTTSSCNFNSLQIRQMASMSNPEKNLEFEVKPRMSRKIQLLIVTALHSAVYWPMYGQQKENGFFLCKREGIVSFYNKTGSVRFGIAASWTLISWPCHWRQWGSTPCCCFLFASVHMLCKVITIIRVYYYICVKTYYLYVCINFSFLKFIGNTLLQNFSPSKKNCNYRLTNGISYPIRGHAVAQSVEALRYMSEGRGFDSRWCHWNFSLT